VVAAPASGAIPKRESGSSPDMERTFCVEKAGSGKALLLKSHKEVKTFFIDAVPDLSNLTNEEASDN
jgi:hypothetical protein